MLRQLAVITCGWNKCRSFVSCPEAASDELAEHLSARAILEAEELQGRVLQSVCL